MFRQADPFCVIVVGFAIAFGFTFAWAGVVMQ